LHRQQERARDLRILFVEPGLGSAAARESAGARWPK